MTGLELAMLLIKNHPHDLVVVDCEEGGVDSDVRLHYCRVALDYNENPYEGAHELVPNPHGWESDLTEEDFPNHKILDAVVISRY